MAVPTGDVTRSRKQAAVEAEKNRVVVADEADEVSSASSSPSNSSANLAGLELKGNTSGGKSLRDRSRIPASAYVTFGSILMLQYSSGMWVPETIKSYYSSVTTSAQTFAELLGYTRDLTKTAIDGEYRDWTEYAKTATTVAVVFSLVYVFFIAPFRAGLWTGARARKHKFHRYMGLLFLTQYFLAWVEFVTNYDGGAATSFLPHFISLNGILQGSSAYFSFKVLPELDDAGYYSDKAVMSRNFVHENIFFTLMTVFGSVYYNDITREVLRSNLAGRIIEYIFVFWPYILIRTWYPITRFSNAGTTRSGRTDRNQRFYEIATIMVKIFFLWAKYFLGFFMNFMIFLNLVSDESWKFMHGMLLLNIGTVSLAIFLHTLRFRKILPPRFTFSLYLVQIYLTFTALPVALGMFTQHRKLCGVAVTGLLCNMTRNRKLHGVWCFAAMCLLSYDGIEW